MRLSEFILASSMPIISEWERFARTCFPAASAMDIETRRDHIVGMLRAIARDLETPQTKHEQIEKSKGLADAPVDGDTAANAHGTDRAAIGYTPVQMVAEFRALRASVLRLWLEQNDWSPIDLQELMRFNEAIDQLLVESITRYTEAVGRSKDLFLGVLGHDLRNPLGAIMTSASAMMKKEGPSWHHFETTSRILTSGARMDAMIGDLIDLTRTRLGSGIPIVRTEVDLERVCRQAVDELIAFHPRFKVLFEAKGYLRGQWDGGRIAQVLSNLIGNAFQYGSQGVPVNVVLSGERDDVLLSVHNEGSPIDKNQLASIFDPFRQLEPGPGRNRDLRSVGLGLYIAQAIVVAHEGVIDVASTVEGGTTFTVRLRRTPRERSA